MRSVETGEPRLTPAKKALVALSMTATVAAGLTGNYYLNPSESLLDLKLTPHEYSQVKTELIGRIQNRKKEKPTFNDMKYWAAMVSKECPTITITNVNNDNLVDKINESLLSNCK